MEKTNKTADVFIYCILILFAVLQIFPFYFYVIRSFQPEGFIPLSTKLYFLPKNWSFINYPKAWEAGRLGTGYLNSIFCAVIYTIISAYIAMLVGYVFAKKQFRGRKLVFIILLSTLMVPNEVILIPNFILVRNLHMTDKLVGIIIPGLVNIVGVFIAKQFMETIPDSIIESAVLDGAGELKIFSKIILPISIPVIATYSILIFTDKWNEYLWPMIIVNNPDKFTVQLSLLHFVNTQSHNLYLETLQNAATIATLLPIIIVYLIFQKRFVEGISITGLK